MASYIRDDRGFVIHNNKTQPRVGNTVEFVLRHPSRARLLNERAIVIHAYNNILDVRWLNPDPESDAFDTTQGWLSGCFVRVNDAGVLTLPDERDYLNQISEAGG